MIDKLRIISDFLPSETWQGLVDNFDAAERCTSDQDAPEMPLAFPSIGL